MGRQRKVTVRFALASGREAGHDAVTHLKDVIMLGVVAESEVEDEMTIQKLPIAVR